MQDSAHDPSAAVQTSAPAAKASRKKWYWFLALLMLSFWVEEHFQERHISKLIFFGAFTWLAQGMPSIMRGLIYGMVTVMCAILLYSWWAFK